jgi:protein-L-isoaspartate(D-aspartate) O-methyltransferase
MVSENEKLVKIIKSKGYLKSRELEEAILKTPREDFIPENLKKLAYEDIPLPIGHEQTISQPSTVILMTEALDVKPDNKILEIGAGSGWQTALLSKLANKGFVYTIEIVPELVKFAKSNLKKIKNVKIIKGDGSLGFKEHAPYDRIIVTCACPEIPQPLINQLEGIMVIPIGNIYMQEMFIITKIKSKIEKKSIGTFMFVPLKGKYGFK